MIRAVVVLSPTVCGAGDDPLFAQFLADGGGKYFDIAAFHGYNNSTGEGIVPVVQDFQAVLAEYGLSNVPIWDTEWGMEAPTVITDTAAQEAYVSTGLILQAALGVQTEIFYAYDNANTALYNTATGQLTAAGVAYQQTEQWLTGATEPSGYQLNGSVYTVQLTKNGQNDLIVWNSAGQSSYAAGPYTQYVDAQGQVHTIVNGTVTIGTIPVLLETPVQNSPVPTVASVATSGTGITNGNGDLTVGSVVTLTLNMSEAVTVAGGTPTLTLNDGGTATYTGGSGGGALTFSYTVGAGQNTPDLTVTAVNLNGASIKDSAGNTATLSGTLTPPGTLQIDTTAPAAPAIASDTVNANNTVTLNGTAEANSTVTVYDGQTALGTTAANAAGAWTYTTGTLANGAQVFTATATDAAGNTSAVSSAVDPTIGLLTGTQAGTRSVANGTVLDITGTINNTGTIALNATGNGADLAVVTSATLTGSGKVTLSNNAGNLIGSNGAPATLTNVNNTIAGAGTIGDGNLILINQGVIDANQSNALVINTGGNTVTNSGTLEAAASGGLVIESKVSNSKTIEAYGTNAKVVIESSVTNATTGLILASGSGAQVDLDNATISGGKLQTSGSNAFIETVSGSTDALNGVTITAGSTVEINAATTLMLGGTVANSGVLLVNGGVLDVNGALTGGTTEISGAGEVVMAQKSSESVAFLSKSTGELVLDQAPSFSGSISGLGTTQSIDLTDINFAAGVKISYSSNNRNNTSGVLTVTDGTNTAHLQMVGTYTLANFKVESDGAGGTLLSDPTVVTQRPGNAAEKIGNNVVLEINTRDSGNVTFTGTNGALWLDQPSTFTGKVSGFGSQNVIDLSGIAFDAQTTLGYSPNSSNTGGTLSLSDGVHSAKIALLGNYMASSFVTASDNHGGTMVVAEASSSSPLANPQHA